MNETPNHVEKLKQVYRLWSETRGESVGEWLELMAEDVTLRSLGDGLAGLDFSAGRRGKAEAAAYFAGLAADWEMVHFIPEEFIVQGDRVVVLSRMAFRHRKSRKVAESPKVDVYRFRNGLIVEATEFFDTHAAVAASVQG